MSSEKSSEKRSSMRAHSSYDADLYRVMQSGKGLPIQCQFCSGQAFRRSRLRSKDFEQILMMRYPVRCLRCSQRQMVSFTVASLSLSSSIKPRRKHRPVDPSKRWIDFTKHPDAPNPLSPTPTEEESHSRR